MFKPTGKYADSQHYVKMKNESELYLSEICEECGYAYGVHMGMDCPTSVRVGNKPYSKEEIKNFKNMTKKYQVKNANGSIIATIDSNVNLHLEVVKDKSVDLSAYFGKILSHECSGIIDVRSGHNYSRKAFWLNPIYNWEIKKDDVGTTVLVPTIK